MSNILQETKEFPLNIGSIQVQHLNKIVIKDIFVADEKGDTALNIPKITAHISPFHLLRGDIRVNTLMIGSPSIILKREEESSPLNIQFIIDKLQSKEESKKSKLPDIRINHIQLYDGILKYDITSAERKENIFDPAHISIKDLVCNLSLKKLNSDTLSLFLRSISGKEQSGISLERLSARINANTQKAEIKDFTLLLPDSKIKSNKISFRKTGEETFHINAEVKGEKITPRDFAPFFPSLSGELPQTTVSIKATGDEKRCKGEFTLGTIDKSLSVRASATIANILKKTKKANLNINEWKITKEGIQHLQTIICDSTGNLDAIKKVGNINLTANTSLTADELSGNIVANADNGSITGDFFIDKKQNYSTTLHARNINLCNILQDKNFEQCNIEINAKGAIKEQKAVGTLSSVISSLRYKEYEYSPISIEGDYSGEHLSALLSCHDQNASGTINVSYKKENKQEIEIKSRIDSIKPYNLNLSKSGEGSLSAIIEGKYTQYRQGKSLLDTRVYNIIYKTEEEEKSIRTLHVTDNNLSDIRHLLVSSDFMDVNVTGVFDYTTLPVTFNNILHTHLPAIATTYDTKANNFYSFKFNIKNTKSLSDLLGLPFAVYKNSTIVGQCDDNRKFFNADIKLNDAEINGREYSSISVSTIANDKRISIGATIQCPQKRSKNTPLGTSEENTNITIDLAATANNISSNINWAHSDTTKSKGTLNTDITFKREETGEIETTVHIKPCDITHNGTLWRLSTCNIIGNKKEYFINNFALQSKNKFINIHGSIGKNNNDKLAINLKDIKLEDIFDLINFHSVDFGGNATGRVELSRLLDSPQFSSNLNVKEFTFEKGYMGELNFKGEWDEKEKSILINGDIYDKESSHTTVKGFVSPANDTINLRIGANRTRLSFLNSMLDGIISDIDGEASGEVYVIGALSEPNLVGEAEASGTMRVVTTNTKYTMNNEPVKMTHNKITFDKFNITDAYGNKGSLNGSVNHKSLSDFTCNFKITADNLLAYHTTKFGEYPFYGTAFVTGEANLTADERGLFLHAKVASNAGSTFVYDAGTMNSITSNNFITFTDKQKEKQVKAPNEEKKNKKRKSLLSRLNLEFVLDVTQDMQLKVFTNVKTGDYIDIYGNGPITAVYDERAGFSMKGNLDIERGTYKFTMQDIFPKEFDITKGSTLTFDGDPFLADLNLKTKYLVPSASLSDLDPDGKRHRSVKVNCLMDITGNLESPRLAFDIELPDANEEERELLASAINTPEQKNTQFIYLMGIGKFYTYDYNRSEGDTQSSSAMESLISNTISGQLNNMLSQIIDNRNWNISGNFSSSERGWNSMEVEGILEGRLLDNRLLINGNFGYRENPMANTNFVGDFEVQWLLDKNGNVSLKAYSKTNDRYFSEATLTTQGAGIILRHDFNKWRWWLKSNKKKQKKEKDFEK